MTSPVDVVRRVIDDVMNARNHDLLDELCTPAMAPKLRAAFSSFLAAFPDWHQEAREFVSDGPPSSPGCAAPAPTEATGRAWHPPGDG